jgi:hypothetical protein
MAGMSSLEGKHAGQFGRAVYLYSRREQPGIRVEHSGTGIFSSLKQDHESSYIPYPERRSTLAPLAASSDRFGHEFLRSKWHDPCVVFTLPQVSALV